MESLFHTGCSLYSVAMMIDALNNKSFSGVLEDYGLLLIGSFALTKEDVVAGVTGNWPARTLLMIGNGGSSIWPFFRGSPEYADGQPDPLDRWSRRVGNRIARDASGIAIFPFEGPPHQPFLSWADKTGLAVSSRLSLYIHKTFGLWHAYRFALVVPGESGQSSNRGTYSSPCLSCEEKPCLAACPVNAFAGKSYRVEPCIDYLIADSTSRCRELGCEARRACPIGKAFTYLPEHAKFHMEAFVKPHIL